MALHTRANFCRQLGISGAYLKVNIDRGKVFVNKKNQIDDENPFNIEFVNRVIANRDAKKEPIEEVKTKESKDTKTKYELETRKKELEVEHLDVQINIKRITEAKLKGEMIPILVVKEIIAQFAKHLVTEFDNVNDKVLTIIAQKTKMDNSGVSEFRGVIKDEINKAQKQAVDMAKRSMANVIKEMQE
jgi:hypothetical protein